VSGTPQPPRLVGLFRELWDDNGNPIGWTVVGWGLVFPDKSAVTVPVAGTTSATVWQSLDHALQDMDVQTCDVNPRPFPKWWRDQQ
jgi:hypothetical protein